MVCLPLARPASNARLISVGLGLSLCLFRLLDVAKYCAGAVLLIRILTTLTVDTVTWHGRPAVRERGSAGGEGSLLPICTVR